MDALLVAGATPRDLQRWKALFIVAYATMLSLQLSTLSFLSQSLHTSGAVCSGEPEAIPLTATAIVDDAVIQFGFGLCFLLLASMVASECCSYPLRNDDLTLPATYVGVAGAMGVYVLAAVGCVVLPLGISVLRGPQPGVRTVVTDSLATVNATIVALHPSWRLNEAYGSCFPDSVDNSVWLPILVRRCRQRVISVSGCPRAAPLASFGSPCVWLCARVLTS